MRYILLAALFLSGCATPVTTMRKGDSVVTCGGGTSGSVFGGYVGYNIQKGHDRDCTNEYTNQGYKIANP